MRGRLIFVGGEQLPKILDETDDHNNRRSGQSDQEQCRQQVNAKYLSVNHAHSVSRDQKSRRKPFLKKL